ncbi:hypothetical protein EVAR_66582_1 [Eumeta japonica]|uniref:Uncharacterized protein n=1 Tax=Eumeta variegata TaxID=151549 RepID=A0A4C1Z2T9_EUMVA|nr:hypothetical protein EVAR_66582_1 [Eumeta japonica]
MVTNRGLRPYPGPQSTWCEAIPRCGVQFLVIARAPFFSSAKCRTVSPKATTRASRPSLTRPNDTAVTGRDVMREPNDSCISKRRRDEERCVRERVGPSAGASINA